MVSQYAHPHPAVKRFFEGNGWKTDAPSGKGEGLLWVVRTQEAIDGYRNEELRVLREYEAGALDSSKASLPSDYADEYVLADRVELRDGTLIFELGTPQHNVAVKVYAPGYWREFHLLGDAEEMARHTATMLRDDDE